MAACIDPPVAGHIMPYPAKAPPPPLSSRIASRTPPAVTQRLAGVGFHRRVFDCTPSTHDANRDLVWLRRQALDGGAGGGMCETGRGKPLFRGQKVTPANLIFWYLYFFTTSRHLFIYLFIYLFIFCCCNVTNEDIAPSRMSGPVPYFFGGTPSGKVNQAHVPALPVWRFICLPLVRQADEPRSMKHRR